jgi:Family of unknown function (DUF6069)
VIGAPPAFIMSTVDGVYEGPNGELDFWTDAGDDFDTFSTEQLDTAGTPAFGRATYEGMDLSGTARRFRRHRNDRARRTPMTTTPHPTYHEPGVQSIQPSTRRLVRSGALAGAIAAVGTTAVAAIARAADVSLEINATVIPIPAFAWWTIIGAALGVVLARLLRKRRWFVVVTMLAAGLSLIPAIAAPDDTATKAILVGTHLLAAAIIIPTLSQRLTAVDNNR